MKSVSAVMITGRAGRAKLANVAVRCFLEQTYARKELIVINDGPEPLLTRDFPDVREFRITHSSSRTLGELRNIGLCEARCDLVIQWDDDDWFHPERIKLQASNWRPGAAVLLKRQVRFSTVNRCGFIYERESGIHGTIMHERSAGLKYFAARRSEDTYFLSNFKHVSIVDAPALAYVRLFHGGNTWDGYHIMGALADPANQGVLDMSEQDANVLREILAEYYGD